MTTVSYRFAGTVRSGRRCVGETSTPDLPAWVEAKYRSGWRDLSVMRGGDEVAGISQLNGRRTWWAES